MLLRTHTTCLLMLLSASFLRASFSFSISIEPPSSTTCANPHMRLFPQGKCKTLHLIRHAEGIHNEAERVSTMDPPSSILLEKHSGLKFWDSPLTPLGESQCFNLQKQIKSLSLIEDLDLVVVSPLTRTLQTAFLSLGTPEDAKVPWVATELCRERIANFTCDGRRKISVLKEEFPGVDFSLVQSDEDVLYHQTKEDSEKVQERGREFLKWVSTRDESNIAVVTHSFFIYHLLTQFKDNLTQQLLSWPLNAEMKSVHFCS